MRWVRLPALFIVAVWLVLLVLAGGARANTSVTLTPGTTNFASPIGITYSEPLKRLLLSVNLGSFASLAPDGTYSPYSSVSGIGGGTPNSEELYPVAIRTSGCEGGFKPGDVYFEDNQTPGVIGKITVNPTTGQPVSVTDPWVTLPLPAATKAGTYVAGLFQDSPCSFGGDLIATTYNDTNPGGNTSTGAVWRVTSTGVATPVASNVGAYMEGPTTVPNLPRYGPWAGTILASDEGCRCIYSVAANGAVSMYQPPGWQSYTYGPEGVTTVPPNENLFAVDWGSNTVDQAPASQFRGVVGDVLVYTEGPGALWDVKWNAVSKSFVTYDLLAAPGSGDAGQFEGVGFAPARLLGVTATKTADASTASPGSTDGYTVRISNPSSSAVSLSDITDTLPAGFTYVAGSSTGVTTKNPTVSGRQLTWAGSFTVPATGSVSLHFTVNVSSTPGTYYNNAGGDGSGFSVTPSGPTAPVTIPSPRYTLTVAKAGVGLGTVVSTKPSGTINCGTSCSAQFNSGQQVTLSATPGAGSTFAGWSGGGCSGTGTCAVTMSSNQSVTATFTVPQYTLAVAKAGTGSGSVSSSPPGISCGSTCSAQFSSGQQTTLTAAPAAGSAFAGWSGGGCSGTGTCVVTMSSNQSVTATFTHVAQWKVMSSPNVSGAARNALVSVSCWSTTGCFAVGQSSNSNGQALLEEWTSSGWALQTLPALNVFSSGLNSVSCASGSACTAVGFRNATNGQLAERWNGSAWSVQTLPSLGPAAALESVSCPSVSSCTASGSNNGAPLVEQWSSAGWVQLPVPVAPAGGSINATTLRVSCKSTSACTIVGSYHVSSPTAASLAFAESWNGTGWTLHLPPNPTGAQNSVLAGVACVSSTACMAVGNAYYAITGQFHILAEQWNGTAWRITNQSQTTPGLESVSCLSAISCEAVGDPSTGFAPLAEVWSGSAPWKMQSTQNPAGSTGSYLYSVSCRSTSWCMAVGKYQSSTGTNTLAERYA